jgi:DNA (cytosine-5)-methyltransferase 1
MDITKEDTMKYLSLFSGIEAFSQAVHDFGWTCVGVSEIDPFACAVLEHHYPNVLNLGDITKITKEKLDAIKREHGAIDIVVGGSPCQSFSVAGLRKGLDDPRGNLMLEYIRIVATVCPRWFIWENVTGVLSSKEGSDFGSLLQAMAQFGYSLCWRVLDAQHFGVPQRRRRVFLIGCLDKADSPFKVLFECPSSKRNTHASRETRQSNLAKAERSTGEHGTNRRGESNEKVVYHSNHRSIPPKEHSTCPTLMAWMGTGGNNIPMKLEHRHEQQKVQSKVRKLTPIECERLQGFPDNYTQIPYKKKKTEDCPDFPRYKALGNSMAVPVMRWIACRIALVDDVLVPSFR